MTIYTVVNLDKTRKLSSFKKNIYEEKEFGFFYFCIHKFVNQCFRGSCLKN